MKCNIETLRMIKDAAAAENSRLYDAMSINSGLAAEGLITRADAEKINAAIRPKAEKAGAIVAAAGHALANAIEAVAPALPFAPAPKPLTDEEKALIAEGDERYLSC